MTLDLPQVRLIRQRIRKISRCDIFADDPLLGSSMGPYGVVAQTFCLDDLTQDKREWFHLNQKLANLVGKDGLFITVTLLNASYWTLPGATYPAVTLTPADIVSMYSELGFSIIYNEVIDGLKGKIGYDGFIMTCGKRTEIPGRSVFAHRGLFLWNVPASYDIMHCYDGYT